MPDIVTSIEEVTVDWLTEVLRESEAIASDCKVVSYDYNSDFKTVGILSQLLRINLAYKGAVNGVPETLVIKLT